MAYNSQGSPLVNYASETDWLVAVRRDNVISITLQIRYFSIK